MTKVYLKVEGSTGAFFEAAPKAMTPEDAIAQGYVKTETTNLQTKDLTVSYRRYIRSGVFGNLRGFSKRESEFQGRKIYTVQVVMDNADKIYFMDFPMVGQKNDLQSFAQDLITYLPFLVPGKPYRIFPYVIDPKNATDRKKYGVSINHARLSDNAVDKDNKVKRLSFTYEKMNEQGVRELVQGDIPKIEWVANPMEPNKNIADRSNQTAYLVKVLHDHTIPYGGGSTVNTFDSTVEESGATDSAAPNTSGVAKENISAQPVVTVVTSAPVATAAVPEAQIVDDEDEDLPF
jgi:hypothetical protein